MNQLNRRTQLGRTPSLNPAPVPAFGLAVSLTVAFTASFQPAARAENVANSVIQYTAGTGAAVGYDLANSALGEPSRVTPGEFGGPVDPFSGPWQAGQLVSIGAGGSLTLRFASPVFNLAYNPYGLDFSIFGSAAFIITNGDFTGGGITDGSMFGNGTGETRVSVSADGSTFYVLNPAVAPRVDGLFPTDGSGDFTRPVDPSLKDSDFAGLDLAGIRERYAGSGGGTGFDIGWARDNANQPVSLDHIEFVRIDVLSDRAEIDALVAVPEPTVLPLLFLGSSLWMLPRVTRRRR